MFENIRVIGNFITADLKEAGFRKKYGYSKGHHAVKENRAKVYRKMQGVAKNLIKSTKMELEIRGRENLPEKGPALYVATHQSVFDIVVLFAIIDDPCIAIGKKEVAKMPVVSKWFDALGCIYMDREDKRKALQSIIQGIEELKGGQSIMLFPEGTRQTDNQVGHFKEGSFKLASKTQVPIVPIALSNTYKVFEEKKRIQKVKVVVNIGEVIQVDKLTKEELASLPADVEETVRKLMKEIT